ncbi:hypothetical protein LJY25_17360 [Hymenobacter sp. BT175]|uniref:hypothetical protein n=1 Tax=Hymenobacter translucens TaxID=2886507 RepID=UPI001D0F1DA4|nr:hypothetical protein [Hymenobacter translucens]MCC2548222.1 hypothetical protein [Hymenobacter translucens]
MSIDLATFLRHTPEAEKTTIYVQLDEEETEAYDALLIAQTPRQKLFITLEARRRYVTHTLVDDDPGEVELDFVQDYAEVEALLEDAGLYGAYDEELGILYHNLLYLLMNP